MTTMIPTTRRLIAALFLMIGLMIHMSTATAQSRGSTEGRKSKSERTEKKSSASSKSKTQTQTRSRQESKPAKKPSQRQPESRGASRQRSGSSTNRTLPNQRSANTNSRQSGSNRAATSRGARSGSASQRSGTSRGESSANTDSRATTNRGTRGGSSSQRSGASRGSASTNRSTRTTDESSNGSDARQRNARGASSRGTRGSSDAGTRRSNTRTTNDDRNTGDARRENARSNRDTRNGSRDGNGSRQQNEGRAGSSGRNTNAARGNRSGNSAGRQQADRGRDNGRGNVRVDNRRSGSRRDATRVGTRVAVDYGWRNTRQHRVYNRGHWRYKNKRVYVNPVYNYRPHVQVNVVWPWQNRYRRQWRPSYRYCQVVYVESGYRGNYRRAKVDIRTNYHHEVRYADHNKAVVDIYLDAIEVYEDGYYLGKVKRFPRDLAHIEATIYRNGDVVYDRDVFIVGDPRVGFEMISTRHYDGYVMDHYDRSHGMEVGRLNFRRKRVDARRYSKLFDPYDYNGYTPISVLPEDQQLLDFGFDAISYHHYDDNYDPYYGGSYDDDYYDYDRQGNYAVHQAPRHTTSGGFSIQNGNNQLSANAYVTEAQPLTLNRTNEYKTKQGVAVKIKREATLERIK